MPSRPSSKLLDLPLPERRHLLLGLVLFRRLAAHGPHDARASMMAMDVAGSRFRKLLVLTRVLLVDLSRASKRTIRLAPCCAAGMTRDEGLIVRLLDDGGLDALAALTDDDGETATARETAVLLGKELREVACRNGWKG